MSPVMEIDLMQGKSGKGQAHFGICSQRQLIPHNRQPLRY